MMSSKPWVYIASPYTSGDPAQNVRFQLKIWNFLVDDGRVVPVAPLWSHFQHLHQPRPYGDWVAYDNEIISRCDACLRLDAVDDVNGYFQHESRGADAEVALFERLGRPVFFTFEEMLRWASDTRSLRPIVTGHGPSGSSPSGAASSQGRPGAWWRAITIRGPGSTCASISRWLFRGLGGPTPSAIAETGRNASTSRSSTSAEA